LDPILKELMEETKTKCIKHIIKLNRLLNDVSMNGMNGKTAD